jgi:hypothetical protein
MPAVEVSNRMARVYGIAGQIEKLQIQKQKPDLPGVYQPASNNRKQDQSDSSLLRLRADPIHRQVLRLIGKQGLILAVCQHFFQFNL